jgi:type I restriction enzyme S subunit
MAFTSLESICKRISSGGTPSRKHADYFTSSITGHLWVKSKELLDSAIEETEERISDEGLKRSSAKYYPTNTVLIAMYGANVGQLGWLRTPATVNQAICGLVIDEQKADWRFVFYSLLLRRGDLTIQAQGAAQQNLNQELIRQFCIDIPSLPIQRRIAGILSAYDELIENSQRRIKILEAMARALYREWFVHFRFPGHESVPRVPSPLGDIPQGWEVKKLGEIAEEMRRNVAKGKLEEALPYVGLEHIPRRSLALDAWETTTDLGSNKLEFKKGEVLFGKIRPYFHKVSIAPFDGLCSADTIVVRARRPEHYAFVVACVSSDEFVAHATATSNGSKMPRANWGVLEERGVVIPSGKLAGQFSTLVTDIIDQQQALVFQIQNLRRTRDLLLLRLLSGQIDVEAVLS